MKPFLKIFFLITLSLSTGIGLLSQELISMGQLESVAYEYSGKENFKTKKTLTHIIAYSYSKDLGEVQAEVSYKANYQTTKIEDKGFETIVRLGPKSISGHTELLDFDFSNTILPELKSISLYMFKGDELIYVKNIANLKAKGKSLYFSFKHQRFSKNWSLELRKPVWEFEYDENEFHNAWEHISNYQIASKWLKEINNLIYQNKTEEYILKYRFLKLFELIQEQEFYTYTKNILQQDPNELHRNLEISIYKYEKDLELLKNQIQKPSLEEFVQYYFSFENLLLDINSHNQQLYGDLYLAFDPQSNGYFNDQLIEEFIPDNNKSEFDILYQKKALNLIQNLIENQHSSEALFQIQRFETYYQNSKYLNESMTFKHFKARTVYEIYLNYIKVSKKAMEHNQIAIAINYLDKASNIQENYPSEIINNIMVENQMRSLIRKAMSKYQLLIDEGKEDSAKKVKEGILGLMKKLGFEPDTYPIG